jgi:hypothetical protein
VCAVVVGVVAAGAVVVLPGLTAPVAATESIPYDTCDASRTSTSLSNAGAGTQVSSTVGTGGNAVEIFGVRAMFTADATVVNRYVSVRYTEPGGRIAFAPVAGTITAGRSLIVTLSSGAIESFKASSATQDTFVTSTPLVSLKGGGTLSTNVGGMQAGDTWTNISYGWCFDTPGPSPPRLCDTRSGTTTTSSTTTTLAPSEASPGDLCEVVVSTGAGLGLAGTTAAGLGLFAAFAVLVISFRHRRA